MKIKSASEEQRTETPPPPPLPDQAPPEPNNRMPRGVRVRALVHLGEPDINGDNTHRNPGDIFELDPARAAALEGNGLIGPP